MITTDSCAERNSSGLNPVERCNCSVGTDTAMAGRHSGSTT
ncbi:hypothetical protein [Streptomyces sp. TLI_171]|nr:hypothetical protein [Streptomyces sp. TLI_171]